MKEKNAWVLELSGRTAVELFAFVARAMSKDEMRKVLCGTVFVDRSGEQGTPEACVLVSTDGRRIHAVRWDETVVRMGLLPKQGIYKAELIDKGMEWARWLLTVVDGDYPDWRKCIADFNWDFDYRCFRVVERNLMHLVWVIENAGVPVNVDYLRDTCGVGLEELTVVSECKGTGYLKLEREDGLAFAVLLGLRLEPGDVGEMKPPRARVEAARRKEKEAAARIEAEKAEAAAEVYEEMGRT